MVSEISKHSESFGMFRRSVARERYFVCGFGPVMSFRYIFVSNVVFTAPNPMQSNKVTRMIPKLSKSFGMFRKVSEALILRENV